MGRTFTKDTPVPRTFACKMCGDEITVTERRDRRTVFCSQHCEKRYWKHSAANERAKNTSRGHVVQGWQLDRVVE